MRTALTAFPVFATATVLAGGGEIVNAGADHNCTGIEYCISADPTEDDTYMNVGWSTPYTTSWAVDLDSTSYTNGTIVGGQVYAIRNRNSYNGYTMCIYNIWQNENGYPLVRQAYYYGQTWVSSSKATAQSSHFFIQNTSQGACPAWYI